MVNIIKSEIVWTDIDYLEAARFVALNWSGDKCRRSKLSRILPTRRCKTGPRPGVRGVGPMGAARGDQDQWVFPPVVLTTEERRELD